MAPLAISHSTYEPVATSGIDEFELDDVTLPGHEIAHDEDGRRDGQEPLIKRADGNLAERCPYSKSRTLQKSSRTVAWQGGIRKVTIGASIVLLVNIVFIIFVLIRYGLEGGISTFYTGNCSKASWMDSGLHVAINILSTLFLGASNYVMQILNSPTRERVNHWHSRGASLHIGIPSFANAFRLPRWQGILWFLLGVSAIPLHLFWNSAVYETLQTNEYNIFLVSNNFNSMDFSCNDNPRCAQAEELHELSKTPNGLEHLDTATCIQKYSVDFLQGRRNLLLVGNTTQITYPSGAVAVNGSLFQVLHSFDSLVNLQSNNNPMWLPNSWCLGGCCRSPPNIISSTCYSPMLNGKGSRPCARFGVLFNYQQANSNPWGIDYCLSQVVPEVCSLGFFVYIMAIVIGCNIIKVASVIASLWALDGQPLVIIGDALSSFLTKPDEVTEEQCLTEARPGGISCPEKWQFKTKLWMHAPPLFSIFRCFLCCTISLIAAFLLLAMGLMTLQGDFGITFSNLAFSAVNPSAMVHSTLFSSAFTSAVLVANAPQLLFSTLYFMYNRILTAMLSMDEWSRLTHRRATLRVSYPTHGQRSSYWLSLPYRYSIPLLIVTSIMHWLVLQSLYLASIEIYDSDGELFYGQHNADSNDSSLGEGSMYSGNPFITSIGYSPKAIIASMAVGGGMLLFLVALGFRRYRPGMVLVGNDSRAINAACHPPKEDKGSAKSKLMWGAVYREDGDKPGHCCLTSRPVTKPIEGQRYA